MEFFLLGIILGLIYIYLVYPKDNGDSPYIKSTLYPIFYKGMIIIPYNNTNAIHIQHWIISLLILIIFILYKQIHIVIGFFLVLCIQGLTYNDRFNFICNNPYSNIN